MAALVFVLTFSSSNAGMYLLNLASVMLSLPRRKKGQIN